MKSRLFIRSGWWKLLAPALLLYAVIGGLTVPLGAGVRDVVTSDAHIEVRAELAHFDEAEEVRLWLACDAVGAICVPTVEVVDANTLRIPRSPLGMPGDITECGFLDLIINTPVDGDLFFRRALTASDLLTVVTPTPAETDCTLPADRPVSDRFTFPQREILEETIRNLFYHVPMWFAMVLVLFYGFVHSIRFLVRGDMDHDRRTHAAVRVGLVFGTLGILTGMVWATYTWGTPWTNDPKLNGAAIGLLTYAAYMVLRGSVRDPEKRARLTAVYNILGFVIYIAFIFVIPRLTDSLHPGNGGNPGFSNYDLDSSLRVFFYPAVAGWTILGFWMADLLVRFDIVRERLNSSTT